MNPLAYGIGWDEVLCGLLPSLYSLTITRFLLVFCLAKLFGT